MQEIQDAVAALVPEIGRRGDEIAELRRLPPDLVSSLREAGAFRIALPKARGGPEMTPREQTQLVEVLSRADASVGWCVMIGSDAPYYGSFMDTDVADKLFADPDAITAGLVQPAGQAHVDGDGYRVSGRWAFGSGCTHADVIVGGCLVFESNAPRAPPATVRSTGGSWPRRPTRSRSSTPGIRRDSRAAAATTTPRPRCTCRRSTRSASSSRPGATNRSIGSPACS